MLEQDYIMRLIREIIRAILKLCFHIDTETPGRNLLESEAEQKLLDDLFDRIDSGCINEAENELFQLASNDKEDGLKLGLLFYSYLNDKEDAFLEEHHFSRDEIQQGIQDLAVLSNITGVVESFISDF
ncbi:MAG: DUF6483 family protein [Bacteroides sp.]|nr:DUF6483 family protein [Bacteroides sp.]MCM1549767.1 DUF6483 family protein [Clostridium sp.]